MDLLCVAIITEENLFILDPSSPLNKLHHCRFRLYEVYQCMKSLCSLYFHTYCDKSISYIQNEERGSGTRNKDPERGMRIRNEDLERGMRIRNEDGVRDTLRPCVNSVITLGNEDLHCVHMWGRVTLFLDV